MSGAARAEVPPFDDHEEAHIVPYGTTSLHLVGGDLVPLLIWDGAVAPVGIVGAAAHVVLLTNVAEERVQRGLHGGEERALWSRC